MLELSSSQFDPSATLANREPATAFERCWPIGLSCAVLNYEMDAGCSHRGLTPIPTDVTFEKLSDCLAAEEQLRQAYADAFDAWNQRAATTLDRFGRHRERDFHRTRELEAKKFANTGNCVPHAGSDQPIASLNRNDLPASTPTPLPSPST